MTDVPPPIGLREVVMDTETTGLDPRRGDRVVEIACIELIDLLPTGRTWHRYLNPERDIPEEARKVHGLTRQFLIDKPKFAHVAREFIGWVGDSPMVAHNAPFDFGFINAELKRVQLPPLANRMVDTLPMARSRFPGAKVTLDDLCRKFGIDLSRRTRHEAMLDTELLARVYLELRGGRHRSLDFGSCSPVADTEAAVFRPLRPARPIGLPSEQEWRLHADFLKAVKEPLWNSIAEAPAQRM